MVAAGQKDFSVDDRLDFAEAQNMKKNCVYTPKETCERTALLFCDVYRRYGLRDAAVTWLHSPQFNIDWSAQCLSFTFFSYRVVSITRQHREQG